MRRSIYLPIALIALFLSGCVVYSFNPLYTEKDLFANDILTGEWLETDDPNSTPDLDESNWSFEHPYIDKNKSDVRDSLSYELTLRSKEGDEYITSAFSVHLIKLGEQYFLDFYCEDLMDKENLTLADFHVVPVHTFAKLTVENDRLTIQWFDQDWLEKLIRENKIRIHHEANDDYILLTAKPQELQKFVKKYVNSTEALKDGMKVILVRK